MAVPSGKLPSPLLPPFIEVGVVDLPTTPTSLFLHPEEQHLVTKTSIFALSTQEISPVSETLQLREMEQ